MAKYGDMSQRVVIVLFDGFQLLDLAGPADVFPAAGLPDPSAGYRVEVTAVRAGAVRSLSGVTVAVETPVRSVKGPIDTLLSGKIITSGGVPAGVDMALHLASCSPTNGILTPVSR